jgi:nucleotide-binding universal stress UspA family protein
MRYVVATDSEDASETIVDYLRDRVTADDEVHVVNSRMGGNETSTDEIRMGEDALAAVEEALGDATTVETHQFVRGNEPHEDVLAHAADVDADELVITLRKRSPAGKALFGSVAQRIMLNADRPMRVVPRDI